MSWHFLCENLHSSPEPEAASWEATCLDGAPAALLSLMPTPEPCCSHDNATDACRDSQSGTTCGRSTATRGAAPSTSLPADSHARTSAQPEKVQESLESGLGCGSPWHESSVKYDLATHGWRTHRCLWDEALPWSSVTLPKWGMMRGGVLWERTTPRLLISGNGSGFWPTPLASDANGVRAADGKRGVGLNTKVQRQTPVADDAANRKDGKFNSRGEPKLSAQVKLWPTPTACMQKGSSQAALTRKDGQSRENDRLDHSVMASDGGQLNPTWVEWLMGWPLLWTSTEPMPLETWRAWESAFQSEPTGCAASATGRSLQLSSSRGES